jgi:hypothetical protein
MKGGWIFAIGLLVGAAGGGAAGCLFMKQKYSQIADEEIASVMARYSQELEKHKGETKAEAAKKAEEARRAYSGEDDSDQKETIIDTSEATKKAEEVISRKARKTKRPYVIDEATFSAPDNPYKINTLKYYIDGAVSNDDDKPLSLEDVDELVGRESLTYFSDDTDAVYVRNEALSMDFEILQMGRTYAEVLKEKPYLAK